MTVKSTGQAVAEALALAMEMDEGVFLAGEGIGTSIHVNPHLPTFGLLDRFGPRRVRDTPVSEAAIAGLAVGASCMGLKPVVEVMFFPFITLASDMLVNHAAKLRYLSGGLSSFPLTVRVKSGAFAAGCQHSHYLEAWFAHVPGLKIAYPSNPADAKGLLLSAIFDPDPVVVVEEMPLYWTSHGEVPKATYACPWAGRASPARAATPPSRRTGARCTWPCRPPRHSRPRISPWRSSTCAAWSPGHRRGHRLGPQDRPLPGAARRHPLLRLWRGARRHRGRACFGNSRHRRGALPRRTSRSPSARPRRLSISPRRTSGAGGARDAATVGGDVRAF